MVAWNNKVGSALRQLLFNGNSGSNPPGCTPGSGGNCVYDIFHDIENREYMNGGVSAQTSPTSPFNGTLTAGLGTGFGTLANRPTTCQTDSETAFGGAAGAMYFATDDGPQGTLYTCSATNTWTVYYRPYTYPHPLVNFVPPKFTIVTGNAVITGSGKVTTN
jgi:hypothetical protein